MANRDLLHKPIPVGAPEEAAGENKLPATPALNKLGVQNRSRDIAGESDPIIAPVERQEVPTSRGPRRPPAPETQHNRGPAFRAPYFNKDIESTGAVNQRTRSMKALRGDEGASDLKKIIIPPPRGAETPDPQTLHSALELMAPHQLNRLDLGSLLARQGAWSKTQGVTAEMIAQRLAQLKQMVQDRLVALARVARLSPQHFARSATLTQAISSDGRGHETPTDLNAAGRDLVHSTATQANGLHARLAKVLGSKAR